MKKYTLIIALTAICTTAGFAQLNLPVAQYTNNQIIFNPGYAGVYDILAVNLSVRKTWVGIPGSPSLINLNGHAPFKNERHALGFVYQRVQMGPLIGNFGYLNYAHKINFRSSFLSLGVQAGFINSVIDWDQIDVVTHPDDIALRDGRTSTTSFDLNLGAYYQAPMFYVGFSMKHLTHPKFHSIHDPISGDDWYDRQRIQTYLIAGVNIPVADDWSLRPEMLLKYNRYESTSITIGAHAAYQNRFFIGAGVRTGQRAISLMAKGDLSEQFRIGYSYDIHYGRIGSFQRGSHEISVNYHIPVWKKERTVTLLWL